jgi:hypothetical protein
MKKKLSISLMIFSLFTTAIPGSAWAATSWTTIFGTNCDSYQCWIKQVWGWAMGAAVTLSVFMVVIAGVLWTTSAGNPDKIGMSKKILLGVVSGLGLLVLARVFLNILGLGNLWIF